MHLRTVMLYTGCVGLFCSGLSTASADDPVLATYYEVTSNLMHSSQFRDALEISPAQAARLGEVLDEPALLEKIRTERRAIRQQFPQLDIESTWQLTQSRIDDAVRSELSKILQPQQLEKAKPIYIQQKYSDVLSPFRDLDLLSRCGVPRPDAELLKPQIDAATTKLINDVNKVRDKFSTAVLAALPDASKRSFVQYAGNKYLPQFEVDNSVTVHDLPYTPFVKTGSLIQLLLSIEHSVKELALTKEQIIKLEALESSRRSSMSRIAGGGRSVSEIRQAVGEASSQSAKAIEAILSKDQLQQLYRSRALSEFTADLSSAFDRPAFIAYLHLTNDQAAEIRTKASDASVEMARQIKVLQQQAFENMCANLAPNPKTVLLRAFDGVWMPKDAGKPQTPGP